MQKKSPVGMIIAIVIFCLVVVAGIYYGTNKKTTTMDTGAQNGQTVTVNYTGKLENGTVFDSNVDPKFNHVAPFSFTLGAGQVIKGWDQGVLGMKVGDKKTLTLPPELAYGAQSPSPLIPANSTLIFDVEVTAIK